MQLQDRLLARIDERIAARHILTHPFYQAWTAGTLPMEALQAYAGQYYRQELNFPTYLAGVYVNCGDDVVSRRQVLENMVEEDRGEENHSELWLRFAEGIGVSREQVAACTLLPETQKAIQTFRELTVDGSPAEGMAAIYVYEAMAPEVAAAKIDGLKKNYQVTDERTLSFFSVHQTADITHREWDRELVKRLVTNADEAQRAEAAAEKAIDAMWMLLDGVQQRFGMPCN